ncbi:MAG: hypothetical protein DCC48_17960 [Acidobacteria bacterium]|nr:MAG: hypothetical protein DCC48_17960 [Acidobacteriota bacterium]
MTVHEQQRHALYTKLEQVLGTEHAATFMQLTPPTEWTDFATKHDLDALRVGLEARIDRLEAEMKAGFQAVDERFEAVDHQHRAMDTRFKAIENRFDAVDQRFESTNTKLDAYRSDTNTKLDAYRSDTNTKLDAYRSETIGEMQRLFRNQTIWLIGLVLAVASLFIATARFL